MAQAIASLFDATMLAMIAGIFNRAITSGAAESLAWQDCVKLYHDGKTADKAKKAELSAIYKTQYLAQFPDANENTPKVTFSRGCQRAEFALKYAVMPTKGSGAGKGKKAPGNGAGAAGSTSEGSTVADTAGAAFTLEIASMAREIGDRAVHFATHAKLRKDDVEAFGKLAGLIEALNGKLGNTK